MQQTEIDYGMSEKNWRETVRMINGGFEIARRKAAARGRPYMDESFRRKAGRPSKALRDWRAE